MLTADEGKEKLKLDLTNHSVEEKIDVGSNNRQEGYSSIRFQ